MLDRLINFSLAQRALIIALAIIILVLGWRQTTALPVDVLPDLTKPTVTILTEAPGLSPEEVETRVTLPLEASLMGVNGLDRLRTTSDIGLSLTFVEFDWGTDIYRARQFVQERLASAQLPPNVTPYMTPATSLMGNIMLISLTDPSGKTSPRDLRTLADWTIAKRLQSIPGIAEVLPMGGGIKQIQVQPDPRRMLALGIKYEELRTAIQNSVRNSTGGYLEGDAQEIMVRNLGMTTDLKRLGMTTVRHQNDRPIRIQDIATLSWETEPMRGDAGAQGHPAVILSITKAPGFDTLTLTDQIESALHNLQPSLPPRNPAQHRLPPVRLHQPLPPQPPRRPPPRSHHGRPRPLSLPPKFPHHPHHPHRHPPLSRHLHPRLFYLRPWNQLHDPRRLRRRHRHGRR